MSKTKIRKDDHGLFVRAGGYLFRPYHSFGVDPFAIDNGETNFEEGQDAKVHHISESMMAIITIDDKVERWESHGSYYGYNKDKKFTTLNSNDIWCN